MRYIGRVETFFERLLREISGRRDRRSRSYYVSDSVANRFEELCLRRGTKPSRAIEHCMERLIELDEKADK